MAIPDTDYNFTNWSGACTGSGVCSFTVNGVNAQTTNNYQNWTANITLTAGVNTINIRTTDSRNNIANTSVNVTYTPVASGETIFGMKTGGSDAFGYTTDIGNAIAIDTRDNCDGQGGKNCMIVGGNKGIAFMEKYTSTGQLVW